MIRRMLFLAGVFVASVSVGQKLPVTITLDVDIVWAGIDRPGDLFIVMANGDVQKYDKTGKKIGSHKFSTPPTLLDPLDGVQSFFYHRKNQTYGTMSYDFTTITPHAVDPAFAVSPWLVCPALRELWILDSADFSIKKTALNSTAISLENALQHLPEKKITDYTSLREYQNYVFLLDKTAGVHVFNPLGKYIRTLGDKNMSYFNFLGEELYYVSGSDLIFIDLYDAGRREIPMKAGMDFRFVLLNEDRMYGVGGRTITISEFRP